MARKAKIASFDADVFLANMNRGRTLSEYRIQQVIFTQADAADWCRVELVRFESRAIFRRIGETMSISETSNDPAIPALKGEDTGEGGFGVQGISKSGHGVHGESKTSRGVVGTSEGFHGVFGHSNTNVGVAGETESMTGVLGVSKGAGGIGVQGEDRGGGGIGVSGFSKSGRGIHGVSESGPGVLGASKAEPGVRGESDKFHGVWGVTHSTFAGVFGHSDAGGTGVAGESNTGIGVHGKGGRLAGFFEGDVEVTGDIRCPSADCAEDFDMAGTGAVDPGTVMVLDSDGALIPSARAYDRCVAGVISGAGAFRPAIVLDKQPKSNANRQPLALVGKVFCKVDADFGTIAVGDLLTTSATPGHAMVATDVLKAFGSVIGKALRPLKEGKGLIPILIALQ